MFPIPELLYLKEPLIYPLLTMHPLVELVKEFVHMKAALNY